MSTKIKIAIVIILLGLIALAIGMYQFNKKVPGLEDAVADYTLTADELFDAFESNEQVAGSLYESKVLSVSGEVISVKSNDSTSVIVLKAENALAGGVNCSFNEPVDGVQKGEQVTIKGRCQGYLMDVILNNCVKE